MHIMTNKKKIIVHGIFILVYIVFLIAMNKWMPGVLSDDLISAAEKSDFPENSKVILYIDRIQFPSDLQESCSIQGWVFCETNEDNANKEIWLVFASDERNYAYQCEVTPRTDVYAAFRDKMNIQSEYHGFNEEFSTLTMKNGVYKLCIWCRENNSSYGLADTGYIIRKKGTLTSLVTSGSSSD